MKVDHMISVVGCNSLVKNDAADALPILHVNPPQTRESLSPGLVGNEDIELQRPVLLETAVAKNVGVDLVPEIQFVALNPNRIGFHPEHHVPRGSRWLILRFAKLRHFVHLP